MRIGGEAFTTIWPGDDGASVKIIDQTRLPHRFEIVSVADVTAAARAIKDMQVRGAPLIGVMAAYGLALALRDDASDAGLKRASAALAATRPTAVNLQWALDAMTRALAPLPPAQRFKTAFERAGAMAREDVALCEAIGVHGLELIAAIAARKPSGKPVNILTHCNAGWLATVDWGTATAPIYKAHDAGLTVHVFVDETRPRNQGAALTAFELGQHGVPHTVIADNAGGHLMQHGELDLVIVGTDRTTAVGRRLQQDRHLSQGAGGARQWRAVLCRRCPPRPSISRSSTAVAKSRSREVRRRSHAYFGARRRRRSRDACGLTPKGSTAPTRPSTSPPRGSSPGSSPSAA